MRAMPMKDLAGFNDQTDYVRRDGQPGEVRGFVVALPRLVHHGKKVRVHLPPILDADGKICGEGGAASVGDGDILFKREGIWEALYKEAFLSVWKAKA